MTVTELIQQIEPVAYSVGLLPHQLREMTPTETFAVIQARRPAATQNQPAETENNNVPVMGDSPETIMQKLKLLTVSMGGTVIR